MNVTRNVEKEYLMLRVMTFLRYFGDCLFYAYFTLFLISRGVTKTEVGMICALTPMMALATNPLWNYLSKNANSNRKIMMIITVIEGICILLFTQVNIIELLALLTCLTAVVGSPFYNLHDGFTATYAEAYDKDYKKIRFIGTFAYFCATIVAAIILKFSNDNYNILLYISGGLFILVSLFFLIIKPIDLSLIKKEEVKRNYKTVLKNKTFIVYMIVYFLVVTVSFTADNYVGMFFTEELKLDTSVFSLIFGAYIICEFLVLFILSRIKRNFSENIIWIIITLLYPLRSLLFSLGLPIPLTIASALLRGISYGLILSVNVKCISKICGIENVTAAFFIMAIFTAVVQIISNFLFGNIIDSIGYKAFFGIVAAVGFVGTIINLIYQIKNKFKYAENEKEWQD